MQKYLNEMKDICRKNAEIIKKKDREKMDRNTKKKENGLNFFRTKSVNVKRL